jgi:hypothetical protein
MLVIRIINTLCTLCACLVLKDRDRHHVHDVDLDHNQYDRAHYIDVDAPFFFFVVDSTPFDTCLSLLDCSCIQFTCYKQLTMPTPLCI